MRVSRMPKSNSNVAARLADEQIQDVVVVNRVLCYSWWTRCLWKSSNSFFFAPPHRHSAPRGRDHVTVTSSWWSQHSRAFPVYHTTGIWRSLVGPARTLASGSDTPLDDSWTSVSRSSSYSSYLAQDSTDELVINTGWPKNGIFFVRLKFIKYWPIFKLFHCQNMDQICNNTVIKDYVSNMSQHYLVKC